MSVDPTVAHIAVDIRPGMTAEDIDNILGKIDSEINSLSLGYNVWNGPGSRPCIVNFENEDDQKVAVNVSFSTDWPKNIAIEGVCLGMSGTELREKFPDWEKPHGLQIGLDEITEKLILKRNSNTQLQAVVKNGKVFCIMMLTNAHSDASIASRLRNEQLKRDQEAKIEARKNEYILPRRLSKITDHDAALRKWADEMDNEKWRRLVEWLINEATRWDRHMLGTTWNWGNGMEPLIWIAFQPDTAAATVLEIFWLMDPRYYEKFVGAEYRIDNPYSEDRYELLLEIKARLDKGYYSKGVKSFLPWKRDVGYEPPDYAKYVDRKTPAALALYPDAAFKRIPGKEVVPGKFRWNCPVDYS